MCSEHLQSDGRSWDPHFWAPEDSHHSTPCSPAQGRQGEAGLLTRGQSGSVQMIPIVTAPQPGHSHVTPATASKFLPPQPLLFKTLPWLPLPWAPQHAPDSMGPSVHRVLRGLLSGSATLPSPPRSPFLSPPPRSPQAGGCPPLTATTPMTSRWVKAVPCLTPPGSTHHIGDKSQHTVGMGRKLRARGQRQRCGARPALPPPPGEMPPALSNKLPRAPQRVLTAEREADAQPRGPGGVPGMTECARHCPFFPSGTRLPP